MGFYAGFTDNSDQQVNMVDKGFNTLQPGETGNKVIMYGGNDTVIGSTQNDIILGGSGNDLLKGGGGRDFLSGEDGNDTLVGGVGIDSIYGGAGNDQINAGAGRDFLSGGAGDDLYIHLFSSGTDTINDDLSPTGESGYGGGTADRLMLVGVKLSEIALIVDGNNLGVTSFQDWFNNYVINDGVIIQNYFLGGNYVIELIGGAPG